MTTEELDTLLANVQARYGDRIRTHWDGCWTDASHLECAVMRLAELVLKVKAHLSQFGDRLGEGGELTPITDHEPLDKVAELVMAHHKQLVERERSAVEKIKGLKAELARYSDSPGACDQYRHLADAAMSELGFPCYDEVSPSDIRDRISGLVEVARENRRLACDLESLVKHCWVHGGSHDCGHSRMTGAQKCLFDLTTGRGKA